MWEFFFYAVPDAIVNFVKMEGRLSLPGNGRRKVRTAQSNASCDKQGIRSERSGYRKCHRK
jgi:hypothetical protein